MRPEIAHITYTWQNSFFDNTSWKYPLRIYIHPLYSAPKQRCLGFKRTATDAHCQHLARMNGLKLK